MTADSNTKWINDEHVRAHNKMHILFENEFLTYFPQINDCIYAHAIIFFDCVPKMQLWTVYVNNFHQYVMSVQTVFMTCDFKQIKQRKKTDNFTLLHRKHLILKSLFHKNQRNFYCRNDNGNKSIRVGYLERNRKMSIEQHVLVVL